MHFKFRPEPSNYRVTDLQRGLFWTGFLILEVHLDQVTDQTSAGPEKSNWTFRDTTDGPRTRNGTASQHVHVYIELFGRDTLADSNLQKQKNAYCRLTDLQTDDCSSYVGLPYYYLFLFKSSEASGLRCEADLYTTLNHGTNTATQQLGQNKCFVFPCSSLVMTTELMAMT